MTCLWVQVQQHQTDQSRSKQHQQMSSDDSTAAAARRQHKAGRSPVGVGNLEQALGARQLCVHVSELPPHCRHLVALQLLRHACRKVEGKHVRGAGDTAASSFLTAATLSLSS